MAYLKMQPSVISWTAETRLKAFDDFSARLAFPELRNFMIQNIIRPIQVFFLNSTMFNVAGKQSLHLNTLKP
jgi:hypothetical protein